MQMTLKMKAEAVILQKYIHMLVYGKDQILCTVSSE